MALTVPNTDANAGKAASSASKIMIAIDRFNILIPRETESPIPFNLQVIDKPACRSRKGLPGHDKQAGNVPARVCSKALRRRKHAKCTNEQPDK
jgi:hypothetical protein